MSGNAATLEGIMGTPQLSSDQYAHMPAPTPKYKNEFGQEVEQTTKPTALQEDYATEYLASHRNDNIEGEKPRR